MPNNRAFDSDQPSDIALPYSRIERPLSDEPRLIRGENVWVTPFDTLAKRPCLVDVGTFPTGYRVDRAWLYETLDNPAKLFFVVSVYKYSTAIWEVWYQARTATPGAWTRIPSLRDCNLSTRAHEAVVARGLFYIKAFPNSAGDKLGSVIFDGSTLTTRYWGLLGPQVPATIAGAITALSADVSATATTLNVTSTATFAAAPFQLQVEFEEMTVTAKTATTFTVTRGVNGTTAVSHPLGASTVFRGFNPSDHAVQVNIAWGYSYAYKGITGQVSNRAPVETNPDKLPSYTGPFKNLIPAIFVQGHADTTNIPTIQIYRTTDGGGTWFLLEEIANTGAGIITYFDDSLGSGPTGIIFADPIPDTVLDTFSPAPSLVSNSPPPAVIAPKVTGVDAVEYSTPLSYYSGRIWYGIGNVLFYSAQEELVEGIPEESFPSGIRGNFFRFQYPITNVQATKNSLYITTTQVTYQITGTNRETFSPRPTLENIGHPTGHPRAITRYGDSIAMLTQDFHVVRIENETITKLSAPLYTDLIDAANDGAEFDIKYWTDLNNEWLVVAGHNKADSTKSRFWVMEISRTEQRQGNPFWFVPWTIQSSALISGRISEDTGQRRLLVFTFDSVNNNTSMSRFDPTGRAATDATAAGAVIPVTWYFDAHLSQNPPGNHVNSLRKPNLNSTVYAFYYDRTLFVGSLDPVFHYYLDDLWTSPISADIVNAPPRRQDSKGYVSSMVPINQVCQHFGFRMSRYESTDNFELQGYYIAWTPESGV